MATYTSNYAWTKPGGNDQVDISVLNNNLDSQDAIVHKAFANMAQAFSAASTYAVDDIVLYDNDLYKCHTAVVTPGSWTGSTNWQVYKLSEGGSGGGGTSNYNQLTNKPQINSVELSGNKTSAQLGLMASDGVVANPTGQTTGTLTALEVGGTKYAVPSGGTSDYTALSNKPSINGVPLSGNKTTSELGIDKTAVGLGNVPNVSTNDQTPTFTEASTRNNIASGDKLSVIFGKIQKFFNDLKTVAFSGSYTDLSNKPENANTFQGTIAEWNQLTTAEKKAYDHASIPDSIDGGVTFPANKVVMTGGGNVEDAIDEMTRKVFTYTADGVKTYAQCYNALFNLYKNDIDVTRWQDINFYQKTGGNVASFVCNAISATQLKFVRSNGDNVNWSIHTVAMNGSSSTDLQIANTGGTAFTDQVPENGAIFCVIIK